MRAELSKAGCCAGQAGHEGYPAGGGRHCPCWAALRLAACAWAELVAGSMEQGWESSWPRSPRGSRRGSAAGQSPLQLKANLEVVTVKNSVATGTLGLPAKCWKEALSSQVWGSRERTCRVFAVNVLGGDKMLLNVLPWSKILQLEALKLFAKVTAAHGVQIPLQVNGTLPVRKLNPF